jgi:hypothetical protein
MKFRWNWNWNQALVMGKSVRVVLMAKEKTEMKLYCLMSSKEKKVKYSSTLPFYGLTGLLLVMAPMEHVGSPLTSTSLSFQLNAPGSFLPAPLMAGNV